MDENEERKENKALNEFQLKLQNARLPRRDASQIPRTRVSRNTVLLENLHQPRSL